MVNNWVGGFSAMTVLLGTIVVVSKFSIQLVYLFLVSADL